MKRNLALLLISTAFLHHRIIAEINGRKELVFFDKEIETKGYPIR